MKVLRASDHRRMPWKNGGGVTTEIAAFPPGAGLSAFGWRVSMATVASDGPFSLFPGIDRTLSILSGDGMELVVDGEGPVLMTAASEPLSFAADAPATARLVSGPVTDLNVMTRRGQFSHAVQRMGLFGEAAFVSGRGVTLLLAQGPLGLLRSGPAERLEAGDCALFSGPASAFRLVAEVPAILFRIDIDAVFNEITPGEWVPDIG